MVSLGDVKRSAATLFAQGQHLAALRLYDAIVAVPTDASDDASVMAMINAAVTRWERLDAIFNAAGISGRRFGDYYGYGGEA